MSFQNFIDVKISLATLIIWAFGFFGTVAGVASVYGEQKSRVLAIEQRQDRVERSTERMEASLQRVEFALARMEGGIKATAEQAHSHPSAVSPHPTSPIP